MNKTLVFVYGSLKRGFPLNVHLRNADYIGATPVQGFTLHSAGAFPYMVPCINGTVLGELYDVSAETLAILDRMEQEGTLYKKTIIGECEGRDVYAYLAHGIHNTGFAEWNNQTDGVSLKEELRYLASDLLDEGIGYNAWSQLRDLIDTDEFDAYIEENDGKAYLNESYYSA